VVELCEGIFRQLEGPRKAAADGGEGRVDPLIGGTIEYRDRYIGKQM